MKKLIFLSVFMFLAIGVTSLLRADFYPESSRGVVPPPQYGGLHFSTKSFSTSSTTVRGPLTVASVCFTTSAPTVYAELRMSTETVAIKTVTLNTITRVYNSARLHNSTGTVADIVASGCVSVNIRIPDNLVWDLSAGTLNFGLVLYQPLHGKGD